MYVSPRTYRDEQSRSVPSVPAALPPPVKNEPTIDQAALAAQAKELIEAQKKSTEELHSLVIAVGKIPQCNCQPTDLTEINAKLDAVIAGQGKAPAPTPQAQSEQHVVVVADHNAPYWQRLAEAIAKAQQTYHGIQDSPLPDFPIGIHPQAVVYRNSVPIRIVKGQRDVDDLLSRLSRGDAI